MRIVAGCAIAVLILALHLSPAAANEGDSDENDDQTSSQDDQATTPPASLGNIEANDAGTGTVQLGGAVSAGNVIEVASDPQSGAVAVPAGVVEPKRPADRDHVDAEIASSAAECARYGGIDGDHISGDGSISAEEANDSAWGQSVNEDRAQDQALLDFIVGRPSNRTGDKPIKSPSNNDDSNTDDTPNQDSGDEGAPIDPHLAAVIALLETEEDNDGTGDNNGAGGDGLTGSTSDANCDVVYDCRGERIDDAVSGHIDGEPDGAYAEFIGQNAFGLGLGISLQQNASSTDPVQPTHESPASLMSQVANLGLGDAPSELHVPIFNYCRNSVYGDIEIDPAWEPSFTWELLEDEYDIEGSLDRILDYIEDRLDTNPPSPAAAPPLDRATAIAQLPAWYWITNQDKYANLGLEELSELRTVRVSARAELTHATWNFGDIELECHPEHMRPFIVGESTVGDDDDACTQILTSSGTFELSVTLHFNLEERVERRRDPHAAWPGATWQPHRTTPTATITSAPIEMCTVGIYSVNIPDDLSDEAIAALRAELRAAQCSQPSS